MESQKKKFREPIIHLALVAECHPPLLGRSKWLGNRESNEPKCGEEQSWVRDEGKEWRRKGKEKQERAGRKENSGTEGTDPKNSLAHLKKLSEQVT